MRAIANPLNTPEQMAALVDQGRASLIRFSIEEAGKPGQGIPVGAGLVARCGDTFRVDGLVMHYYGLSEPVSENIKALARLAGCKRIVCESARPLEYLWPDLAPVLTTYYLEL